MRKRRTVWIAFLAFWMAVLPFVSGIAPSSVEAAKNKDVTYSETEIHDEDVVYKGNQTATYEQSAIFNGSFTNKSNAGGVSVAGDASFYDDITFTGNSNMVISGDMYLYGTNKLDFKAAKSHLCVDGTLYYTGERPDSDILFDEPCPPGNTKGSGIYANSIEKISDDDGSNPGDNNGEPSLDFEIKPSKKNLIKPINGPATGNLDINVIPLGILSEKERNPINVVFVVDTSGSMKDASIGNKTKMQAAKDALLDSIELFENKGVSGDQLALVPFSGDVYDWEDLTNKDKLNKLKNSVNELEAGGGTNYIAAFQKAQELLNEAEAKNGSDGPKKSKNIIFLTDGNPSKAVKNTKFSESHIIDYEWDWCGWTICRKPVYDYKDAYRDVYYELYSSWYTKEFVDYDAYYYKDNRRQSYKKPSVKEVIEIVLSETKKEASSIRANNISLYSIGLGILEVNNNNSKSLNLEFLENISSQASYASSKTINDQILEFTNNINEESINNIKLELELPNNASFNQENSIIVDGKHQINITENIVYNSEQDTPEIREVDLPISFSQPGSYTLSNINLVYTDINGKEQRVPHEPITFSVEEKSSPVFNGTARFTEPDQVTQLYRKTNQIGNRTTLDEFSVEYFFEPSGGNGVGSLTEIYLYQPIPQGIELGSNSNLSIETDSEGRHVKIPVSEDIEYRSTTASNSYSKSLEDEFTDFNRYSGITGVTKSYNQNDQTWEIQFETTNLTKTNIEVQFNDDSSQFFNDLKPNGITRFDSLYKEPLRVNVFPEENSTFNPDKLEATLDLRATAAMQQQLPPAQVRYYDKKSSDQELRSTLVQPEENIKMEILLTDQREDRYTEYKTSGNGGVSKSEGNNEENATFIDRASIGHKLVTDLTFVDNGNAIEVSYINEDWNERIPLAPTIVMTDEEDQTEIITAGDTKGPFEVPGNGYTFAVSQDDGDVIPSSSQDVTYNYSIKDQNGNNGESGTLSEEEDYASEQDFPPNYQVVEVVASGGFADSTKKVSFIVKSETQQPTSVEFKKDQYVFSLDDDGLDFLNEIELTPSTNVDDTVTFRVADENVASLSGTTVSPNNPGKTTITVTTGNNKTATAEIIVPKIQFKQNSYSLSLGGNGIDFSNEIDYIPSSYSDDSIKFEIVNDLYVSFKGGSTRATANLPGQTTIKVSGEKGGEETAVLTIETPLLESVNFKEDSYTMTVGQTWNHDEILQEELRFTPTFDAVNTSVKLWKSSSNSVLGIRGLGNGKGEFVAKQVGYSDITVIMHNGLKDTVRVYVKPRDSNDKW